MTAAIIALAHMIPVLAAGLLTLNMYYVRVVTGVMVVIAVIFGNSNFILLDLFALWIAYLLAGKWCKQPSGPL